MSYLVLARKYRPAVFDEVIGQEHITELFKRAITSDRLAHAYLLCGPRGIGKTSCARILAKCLNCRSGPTLTPCGQCPACKEIALGTSFDVLEVDGASNRGIDEIRALRENVKFAPSYGLYKIYIIDEVHMLTTEAFNALLKTLEEPPAHVKFVFATTDPNKVPSTIISRCQRCDFKRISLKTSVDALKGICEKEEFLIEQDALYAIAKAAQGSFRDALSILDQISALNDRVIRGEDVYTMLGLVETDLLFDVAEAVGDKNCSEALKVLDTIIDKGKDIKQLTRDLVEHFRNLMIIKIGGKSLGRLVDYPVAVKEMYLSQTQKFSLQEILDSIDAFIEAQEVARVTESLRTPIEVAFAKLTYRDEPFPQPPDAPAPSRNTSRRVSPIAILKNQKGQVNLSSAREEDDVKEDPLALGSKDIPVSVDLEKIKSSWDALTYGVSREKMSLATYLQEGFPQAFEEKKLTIGFTKEFEFHKETLEESGNVRLVERIFSEKLKTLILIRYKIADDGPSPQREEEPLVKTVLAAFEGKIVSKWHTE